MKRRSQPEREREREREREIERQRRKKGYTHRLDVEMKERREIHRKWKTD